MTFNPFLEMAEVQEQEEINANPFAQLAEQQVQEVQPSVSGGGFLDPGARQEFAEGVKSRARQVARVGSRVGETLLGLPGDIQAIGDTAVDFIAKKVGLPSQAEIEGKIEEREPGILPSLDLKAPTSQKLNEFMNESFKGYLSPQSGGEKFVDEVVTDTAALMLGRKVPTQGGAISKAVKLAKPLFVAVGANLAKEGVDKIGGGIKSQTAAKLGSMIVLDLVGSKSIRSLGKELYKDAEAQLPKGASVDAKRLEKSLQKLETRLATGGTAPSKAPVRTKVNQIAGKIKNGRIDVAELQEFKRDINEVSGALFDLPKSTKAKLRSNFNELRGGLRDTIKEYGKTNPKFIDSWSKAEEVFGAISNSNKARDSIAKAIKANPKLSLIGAATLGVKTGGVGLAAAVPAIGGLKAFETVSQIMKSPTIRKHYSSVINSAIKGDSAALLQNMNKLDNSMKKEGFDLEE